MAAAREVVFDMPTGHPRVSALQNIAELQAKDDIIGTLQWIRGFTNDEERRQTESSLVPIIAKNPSLDAMIEATNLVENEDVRTQCES